MAWARESLSTATRDDLLRIRSKYRGEPPCRRPCRIAPRTRASAPRCRGTSRRWTDGRASNGQTSAVARPTEPEGGDGWSRRSQRVRPGACGNFGAAPIVELTPPPRVGTAGQSRSSHSAPRSMRARIRGVVVVVRLEIVVLRLESIISALPIGDLLTAGDHLVLQLGGIIDFVALCPSQKNSR